MRALVIYGSIEGQTHAIADTIAAIVRDQGWEAEAMDGIHPPHAVDPSTFDLVILGAPIHVGKHPQEIRDLVRHHRDALNGMPSVFFSVSLSAAGNDRERADAERCLNEFLEETGWRPAIHEIVAGALRYQDYGMFKRFLMKHVMKEGGHDTDTSRNHEYTDWQQVHDLALKAVALAT